MSVTFMAPPVMWRFRFSRIVLGFKVEPEPGRGSAATKVRAIVRSSPMNPALRVGFVHCTGFRKCRHAPSVHFAPRDRQDAKTTTQHHHNITHILVRARDVTSTT